MQSISFSSYPDIMRWVSLGMLVVLLGAMPWASLSPAASPPSQWAGLIHMAAMAVFPVLTCGAFMNTRGRAAEVTFVLVLS
ncbi:MAG: hypothetical protein LC657_12695 [Desulfobacteraceae bacterium]|nr:hypothetical protein [Desulfobacteraceae bacterium]